MTPVGMLLLAGLMFWPASIALAQALPDRAAGPAVHHGKARHLTLVAKPAVVPLDPGSDPEIAAALAAIGQPGIDALALPAAPPPDWNARVAAANSFKPPAPSYRTPGDAETLASWGGSDGEYASHLAVTGGNLHTYSAVMGVNAGASVAPGPFTVGAALNGSQSGGWNGAATTQYASGPVHLTAGGSFASNVQSIIESGQLGSSFSANVAVSPSLSLDGAINWSRPVTSTSDARGYKGTAKLSHALTRDLTILGAATISGGGVDTWVGPPQFLGTAGVQWTPGGGPAFSASLSDQLGQDYRLAMGASRPFN